MKKIKIMLASLALLAVVGGTLAFKARFQQNYCTTGLINGACPANAKCPNLGLLLSTTTTNPAHGNIFCTTTAFRYEVSPGVFISTCFTDNDPLGDKTIPCFGTTTMKSDQ